MGIADARFADFIDSFQNDKLAERKVNGERFDEADKNKSTKDKAVVVKKLAILENLLFDFLQMGKDMERQTEIELFLARNLAIDVETLRTDMDFYMESLEDLMRKVVRSDSKLLEVGNRLSLLAMVVYSYKEDIDLDDWLKGICRKK